MRFSILPVTHARPIDRATAVEIPPATKRRLGLDDDQSSIVVTEGNAFAWPGPDPRFAQGAGPESIAYGLLPAKRYEIARDGFVAMREIARARFVRRDTSNP